MVRSFVVFVVLFAMAPAVALATRIVFRDVKLDVAMSEGPIVVVARYVGGQTPHHFEVQRRLSAEGPTSGAIDVLRVETEMMRVSAMAYRATRVRRSPLVSRLQVGADLQAGQDYCVMLQPRHGHYRLATARAHVSAPCPEVEALIRARP